MARLVLVLALGFAAALALGAAAFLGALALDAAFLGAPTAFFGAAVLVLMAVFWQAYVSRVFVLGYRR